MTDNQNKNEDILQDQQVFNRGGKLTEEYNPGRKCCVAAVASSTTSTG